MINFNPRKGAAPIVAVLVVVVLAVVVGGYLYLSKSGTTSITLPGVTPRATEKDFEFVADPILRKHFVAQANVTSWRTVSKSSGKGTTDTTEVQIVGQDARWHPKVNDGTKDISEMIVIGDTTYVKDFADGQWWKQTAKIDDQKEPEGVSQPVDFKEEELKKKDTTVYKDLGKEPCGNLTCYKYQQTDSANPDSGMRIFWFDDGKFLLRQEESGFGEFSVRIVYTYDNINISAPSPTKDVPEGKNIFEYLYPSSAAPEDFSLPY